MISVLFIVAFVFCVAVAAASILVSRELGTAYESPFLKSYFYYLVAFQAFAMYGLWGKVVSRALLSAPETSGAVEAVASLVTLFGMPFLFVSSLMLLNMGYAVSGATATSRQMMSHVAGLLALILGTWLVLRIAAPTARMLASIPWYAEAAVTIGLEGFYLAGFLVIGSRAKNRRDGREALKTFSALFVGAFLLRALTLPLGLRYPLLMPLTALVYVGSSFVPLFYLRLKADDLFEPLKAESTPDSKLARLVERYGITKREKEIIEQVCLGKTNKQIADTLFIALQTVKDHTHRIYSKMGISSRMQLVQKLNDEQADRHGHRRPGRLPNG